MQQEIRAEVSVQRIDDLLVIAGAERGDHQRLGFAPGKQRRAMRARQQADGAVNRADGCQIPPVDALAAIDDLAAQDLALELLEGRAEVGILLLLFGELLLHLLAHRGNRLLALLLLADREGLAHVVFGELPDLLVKRAVIRRREIEGFLGRFFREIDDQIDHRLQLLMAELDGTEHFLLGKLIGFRFHHHHRIPGAGDDQLEPLFGIVTQVLHVIHIRVEDVFAVHIAHPAAGNGPAEGNAGKRERGRGGDHRHDIGIVHEVMAQNRAHHQHFVLEAFHEKRADRAIDQPRGEGFLLGGARLALEETAGHLARGIVFFLVMHREREEILPRLGLACVSHGGEHAGFAQRRDDGSIRLAGHTARFESEGFIPPFHFFPDDIEHLSSYPGRRGPSPLACCVRAVCPWLHFHICQRSPGGA